MLYFFTLKIILPKSLEFLFSLTSITTVFHHRFFGSSQNLFLSESLGIGIHLDSSMIWKMENLQVNSAVGTGTQHGTNLSCFSTSVISFYFPQLETEEFFSSFKNVATSSGFEVKLHVSLSRGYLLRFKIEYFEYYNLLKYLVTASKSKCLFAPYSSLYIWTLNGILTRCNDAVKYKFRSRQTLKCGSQKDTFEIRTVCSTMKAMPMVLLLRFYMGILNIFVVSRWAMCWVWTDVRLKSDKDRCWGKVNILVGPKLFKTVSTRREIQR